MSAEELPVESLDPRQLTIQRLRSILSAHHVELPTQAVKKAYYIQLWRRHIAPVPQEPLSNHAGDKRELPSDLDGSDTPSAKRALHSGEMEGDQDADEDEGDEGETGDMDKEPEGEPEEVRVAAAGESSTSSTARPRSPPITPPPHLRRQTVATTHGAGTGGANTTAAASGRKLAPSAAPTVPTRRSVGPTSTTAPAPAGAATPALPMPAFINTSIFSAAYATPLPRPAHAVAPTPSPASVVGPAIAASASRPVQSEAPLQTPPPMLRTDAAPGWRPPFEGRLARV